MRTREQWGWRGHIRVTSRYADGSTQVEEFHNLITDAGLNLLRNALSGAVTDAQIKYVALGTSGTSPASGNTQLGAEVYRKAVTARINGAAGVLTTRVIVPPTEAVGTVIAELGWFAGTTADVGANTGVLVARVLYSHTHTGLESIQIDRVDTL